MNEALSRYHTAKGYFQSCIMIVRSSERNTEPRRILTFLSCSMLAAFSLELYFKSWLLASGANSKAVKSYGHKLEKLYIDAKAQGLPHIENLDTLVDALAGGHQDFTFRYIESDSEFKNINWEAAFKPLDSLDNIVDAKVGASASYGLKPGH